MKKILHEWKIFLRENSRFKIDPQVQKLMIDLLLGRIDPLYAGPNDYKEFYQKYRKNVDSHPFVRSKEEELKNLKIKRDAAKSSTRKPPRSQSVGTDDAIAMLHQIKRDIQRTKRATQGDELDKAKKDLRRINKILSKAASDPTTAIQDFINFNQSELVRLGNQRKELKLMKVPPEEIKQKEEEFNETENLLKPFLSIDYKKAPTIRLKLHRDINIYNEAVHQFNSIRDGLSFYWFWCRRPFGGLSRGKNLQCPEVAEFIIEEKLKLFLSQLTPKQRHDFLHNYSKYLTIPEGSTAGVSFPIPIARKTVRTDQQEVMDVWIINEEGMPILLSVLGRNSA